MIDEYTGESSTSLAFAIESFGLGLCAQALKTKIPPVIVAWIMGITTVVSAAILLDNVRTYTERQNFVGLLKNLVDNPRQFTRFKVISTIWMEWHEGPTMGYYTYYTTVSYDVA